MKKSRCTEEQIIGILKQHEAGVKTADLCREHGISDATFYNWKSKYGGSAAPEIVLFESATSEHSGDINQRLATILLRFAII